ncbi:MAG: phosphoesterase, MJ0936 family [halophilic archaeon J07HX5]|jgi:phosphoesterase, MJ0936 family|nr:MAG: phosphoesterase, MJ0936 family [halophilic archaeon J07HX5]
MNIAIISDTHVPSRERQIPAAFRERVRAAEHVLHAGDFDSTSAFADQQELAETLTAVRGNTDPGLGLSRVQTVICGDIEFVLTHGTGPVSGYKRRIARTVSEHADQAPERAVGVGGHTHEPMDMRYDGIRLLNPGTATGAAPGEAATMMTGTVVNGELTIQRHEH